VVFKKKESARNGDSNERDLAADEAAITIATEKVCTSEAD